MRRATHRVSSPVRTVRNRVSPSCADDLCEMRLGCNQHGRTRRTRQRQFGHLAADRRNCPSGRCARQSPPRSAHARCDVPSGRVSDGRLHDLRQRHAAFPADRESAQHGDSARRIACPPCSGSCPRPSPPIICHSRRPTVHNVDKNTHNFGRQRKGRAQDLGRGTINAHAARDGARAKQQERSGDHAAFREDAMRFFAIAGVAVIGIVCGFVEHAGRRPAMAGAAGTPDRAVSGRRQCRWRGARHRRQAAGKARPALHRGKQGRCRRPDRRRGVRENGARWLHVVCRRQRPGAVRARDRQARRLSTGSGTSSRSPRSR